MGATSIRGAVRVADRLGLFECLLIARTFGRILSSAMTQEQWTAVDRYFEQDVFGEDEVFREIRTACVAAGLPPISVSAAQGRFLSVLARAVGARRILEIGTLGGYSGSWFARAFSS